MRQRILSIILAAVMVFTSVDITAFAQEKDDVEVELSTVEETVSEEGQEEVTEEIISESSNEDGEETSSEFTEELEESCEITETISETEEEISGESVESETEGSASEVIEEITISAEELPVMMNEVEVYESESLVASGECGDNLTWELDENGVLTISGTGDMWDEIPEQYSWIEYKDQMKTLVIEEGVTGIGYKAFSECSGFTGSLIIPDSVTSIGEWAFDRCSGFTGSLIIPNSVTSIGDWAFYKCSGFTGELIIPDSVTVIGADAFAGCSGFTGELIIPDSVTMIGSGAFIDCSGFTGSLIIPNSITRIESFVFMGCSGFTGLTIPDSVTTIELDSFMGCSGFTGSLIIPDSVTMIGSGAFYGCSGFTGSLTIPNSVSVMGDRAFMECSGLTGTVIIPNSLTYIQDEMFYNCYNIEKVIIQYGIKEIGQDAFFNCYDLVSIAIPASVTAISWRTFVVVNSESNLVIYGTKGSFAEKYADYHAIPFVGKNVAATGLEVFPENPVVKKGESKQMRLGITPLDCTDTIVWKSSDTSVATVSERGVVSGVNTGTSQITVTVGSVSKKFTVTVSDLVVSPTTSEIEIGECIQLSAQVFPSDGVGPDYEWSSEDESIATVDENGKVKGIARGTTKIYATAQDGSGLAGYCNVTVFALHEVEGKDGFESPHPYDNNSCDVWKYQDEGASKIILRFSNETEVEKDKDFIYIYGDNSELIGTYTGTELAGKEVSLSGKTVRVKLSTDHSGTAYGFKIDEVRSFDVEKPLERISLSEENIVLKESEEKQLQVNYWPENTTDSRMVTWSSNNENVVTVDENGLLKAVGMGETTVQATVGQKTAVCTVKVVIPIEKLSFGVSELELEIGDKYWLQVQYMPENTTDNKDLIWSSSNPAVATVNEKGIIRVTGFGETIIEAKSAVREGVRATCNILVRSCEIQFDSMGGSTIDSVLCGYNKPYDCSDIIPEKENYAFVGWYKDSECQNPWTEEDVVTDDITLYAKWQEAQEDLWILPISEQAYTGKAIKPVVKVYDGVKLLQEKIDYTILYKNNVKVNDATNERTAPTVIVKGKGNYSGQITTTFAIESKDISDEDITISAVTSKYNGRIQKKIPSVTWNGKKLANKKDFTVSYPDLTEENPNAYKTAGIYRIVVTGIANYSGSITTYVTITDSVLMSKVRIAKIKNQPYTGDEINPALTITYKGKPLTAGTDYTVEYTNNVKIGTATAIVTGKDSFAGEKKVTFKITGDALKKAKVEIKESKTAYIYTGREICPELNVTFVRDGKTIELKENKNYTVVYAKNINPGTASITLTGINDFAGTVKKSFKIKAYDINEDKENMISVTMPDEIFYEKGGSRPKPVVAFDDTVLVEGKDYTLSYKKNTAVNNGVNEAKMPTVTIKGKGCFTKSVYEYFCIVQKDISEVKISVADKVYSTKKNGFKSTPVLMDMNGKKLRVKTDYLKDYVYTYAEDAVTEDGKTHNKGDTIGDRDVLKTGTLVNVTVFGNGNYKECITGQYRIIKTNISNTKVTIAPKYYTGEEIILTKEEIEVKYNGKDVPKSEFEIVGHENNTKKGTAKVTIKGVGDTFGGTKTVKFTIKAKSFAWWK